MSTTRALAPSNFWLVASAAVLIQLTYEIRDGGLCAGCPTSSTSQLDVAASRRRPTGGLVRPDGAAVRSRRCRCTYVCAVGPVCGGLSASCNSPVLKKGPCLPDCHCLRATGHRRRRRSTPSLPLATAHRQPPACPSALLTAPLLPSPSSAAPPRPPALQAATHHRAVATAAPATPVATPVATACRRPSARRLLLLLLRAAVGWQLRRHGHASEWRWRPATAARLREEGAVRGRKEDGGQRESRHGAQGSGQGTAKEDHTGGGRAKRAASNDEGRGWRGSGSGCGARGAD